MSDSGQALELDAPTPAARLDLMLQSLAAIQAQPRPPAPPPAPPPPPEEAAEVEPMTLDELYAQFRSDMRFAGFAVYDLVEDMIGVPHDGPAVNVRDPIQATNATKLTLATHALAAGLWRLYPVLSPITL